LSGRRLPLLWAIHGEDSRRPLPDLCRDLGATKNLGLQVRHKSADDRLLLELCRTARASLPGCPITVNGRADLARLAELDGVHLPADGLPVATVRMLLAPHGIVGRSTHDLEEVARARDEAVDFVYFGPVFATPSKPGAEGVGLSHLQRACRLGVPVYALGGISPSRLQSVSDAGAVGAAGLRLFDESACAVLAALATEIFDRGEAT
jgi:thiamine-phosphate pyrophosphorylase